MGVGRGWGGSWDRPIDLLQGGSDTQISGARYPVALHSDNPDWDPKTSDMFPADLRERLRDETEGLSHDTVLVGVVDSGLPLGHRRFRLADGHTRFLASWQQSALWSDKSQSYLPYGQELLRSDIDAALRRASFGDLSGAYDEERFNRETRLVEPAFGPGQSQRDLDLAAPHGAHILDLAAGFDPQATEAEILQRCRLIGVNLPNRFAHGPAGNFLQYFALAAIERVVKLADQLWEAAFGPELGARFPVVVNLSYGLQAGPQDGTLPFERGIDALVQRYAERGGMLRVCMPAGNNNLVRSVARVELERDAVCTLPWRHQPEDPSSNCLEFWTPRVLADAPAPVPVDYSVWVTPPGSQPRPLPPMTEVASEAQPVSFSDLADEAGQIVARVYVVLHNDLVDGTAYRRLRLVICVAPNAPRVPMLGPVRAACAGLWQVQVSHQLGTRQIIDVLVQEDQSGILNDLRGLQSYLDEKHYRTHDTRGALMDSYAYPYVSEARSYLEAGQGPVRRVGSHNPMATSRSITMIGGYERATGMPARYSSTGRKADLTDPSGTIDIEALLPSEDAPGLYGLLACGGRDGAVVAYRGTSMASAMATRYVAEAMLADRDIQAAPADSYGPLWMRAEAAHWERASRPGAYADVAPRKGGEGRLPGSAQFQAGRCPRLG